jgi:hypothetical protein
MLQGKSEIKLKINRISRFAAGGRIGGMNYILEKCFARKLLYMRQFEKTSGLLILQQAAAKL